jgi:acyl-CoA reductase-like NAD-dependent aldehyde dehydrogenase
VHEDAAWRDAVPLLASGAFGFAGQSCISVQRIFVHEKIHAEFREAFVDYTKTYVKTGGPRHAETVVGPMIESAARDRVIAWVNEAISQGARALTPVVHYENCIKPVILENVPRAAKISCEEAFGPVVLIEPYVDFEDALRFVNDSRYGLQAGVFTRNLQLAQRAFNALEVGTVLINQTPTFRVENMPYGGVKESGFGREGIRYAMEEMTERKLCVIRHA